MNAGLSTAREEAMRRRTQLFVPANKPALMIKAATSGADAVILDLEDSVPVDQRAVARAGIGAAVATLFEANPHLHVLVRVNSDTSLSADIDGAVAAGVGGLLIPKVESVEQVQQVTAFLQQSELRHDVQGGTTQLQLLIESPRGILEMAHFVGAERVVAIMLGIEDLAAELEIDPRSPDFDVRWAHGALICAARAHGLAPYGLMGSLANFSDLPSLTRDAEQARAFGYLGALCIHPKQVEILNRAFAPSQEEVNEARAVLEALAEGQRNGTSAVRYNGRMIDTPTAQRARRLLLRAGE